MSTKLVEIICQACGEKVLKLPGRRFCNRKCSNIWCHKNGKRNTKGIKGHKMSLDFLILKYGKDEGSKRYSDFINVMSTVTAGENNPMFGRTDQIHGIVRSNTERKGRTLVEIFGEQRASEIKKMQSKASSGENNPMFGKPSPKGSGTGIKGYYKDRFFRSLSELVCMQHLESEGILLDDVELEKFRIPYIDFAGNTRNYIPDFYIPKMKLVIEVKPKKLVNTKSNKQKFIAANEFCESHGLRFSIFTEDSSSITKSEAIQKEHVVLLKVKNENRGG